MEEPTTTMRTEMAAVISAAKPMPRCMLPNDAPSVHMLAAKKTLKGTALATTIPLPP